ncbi:OmpA family protein [Algihabitans albus]|uniref:OmpA family protein n=1 Tax=Algihabitans albus TaxID=2164067 RepID=UPI000E5D4807|nr:OmpA family protein [Algihabitans albus]
MEKKALTDVSGDPISVFETLVLTPSTVQSVTTVPASSLSASGDPTASALTSDSMIPSTAVEVTVQDLITELDGEETERGTLINLPGDVLFDFDKSDIRPNAEPVLARLASLIEKLPQAPVEIEGHTDGKGSETYNQSLSEQRANSVKSYLVESFGLKGARLRTRGYGENRPVAPNRHANGSDNPVGRQLNRRVEVIIAN